MARWRALSVLAVLAIGPMVAPAAPQPVAPHAAKSPTATGPVPQTATSYAFDSAAHDRIPMDLAKSGYLEQEYFQSGIAPIYEWPKVGELQSLGSGRYTTRLLVRKPGDPQRFNGAVIVEPLNPSMRADVDLMWDYAHRYLMHEGYAWIGVTVKPVSVAALQRFDARRYARLSMANPLPAAERCPDPELGAHDTSTEVGFAPGILSQLSALIHSGSPMNPMRGYAVTRVYLTGYSQTSGYVRDYADAISRYVRLPDGAPTYDGYLAAGQAPFDVPLNDCARLFKPGDPRLLVGKVGVPYLDVAGESDTLVDYFLRQPDGNRAPDLFRRYEIAGATHIGAMHGDLPNRTEWSRAGGADLNLGECTPSEYGLSGFPLDVVLDAMWQNLDAWVVKGSLPPPGTRLILSSRQAQVSDASVATEKDRYGNALAGWRTTAVDVPVATWHSSRGGAPWCLRTGYSVPFKRATILGLYPTHEAYVRKVDTDVRDLLRKRWLTPFDAAAIRREAQAAPVP